MSNKIEQLQTTIQEQEDLAAKLDHSDTSGDYYKNLYELLSVAYFASKDINAITLANIPLAKDNASTVPLKAAEDRVAVLETSLEVANSEIEYLKETIARVAEIINKG